MQLAEIEDAVRKGLPQGSGDYAHALALAMLHKRGATSFDELRAAIVALALPPHPLGDGYLMTPIPSPPPGTRIDPAMMPTDWERTWGEVAMAYHLGELTRNDYDALHAAAHPSCR